MKNYSYPLDLDWTHAEMVKVVSLWNAVESAYEGGISREEFIKKYRAFKEVVPSKGEEKQLGNAFEKISGYSLYQVVKASQNENKTINMDKQRK
ncbi:MULTISPECIES: UPF0223 family protein [unclassified Jeotgalibaca]|uniref:UPF0223 family protein n=1 Tax=unclassified Jeotgalibaca TaxID=2621505 RepID=UPI003FD0F9E2